MKPGKQTIIWAAVLAGYLAVGLAVTAVSAPGLKARLADPARSLGLAVLLLECIFVAFAAPFWAAGPGSALQVLCKLAAFQAATAVLAIGSTAIVGRAWFFEPIAGQAVVFAFGCLLVAFTRLAGPQRTMRMQFIATIAGLAMAGSVFYCNPVVEAVASAQVRNRIVAAVVNANPLAILAGSVYKYDILRGDLYGRCVIGPYYPFRYPGWPAATLGYLCIAAAVGGASRFWRKRHA